eukprot:NODE_358_length_1854_cov_118.316898_g300_i0.p1 GENE.NODE_358_length_1854_cov_118.316898_g300_i0~~NODE_358_length_1854_cov_118.316898_g300_i0.p1  ORF type:complete len:250 (+),score=59.32 NODE_358_length_1854_cov_118.316898_g300_i0:167-916(+)
MHFSQYLKRHTKITGVYPLPVVLRYSFRYFPLTTFLDMSGNVLSAFADVPFRPPTPQECGFVPLGPITTAFLDPSTLLSIYPILLIYDVTCSCPFSRWQGTMGYQTNDTQGSYTHCLLTVRHLPTGRVTKGTAPFFAHHDMVYNPLTKTLLTLKMTQYHAPDCPVRTHVLSSAVLVEMYPNGTVLREDDLRRELWLAAKRHNMSLPYCGDTHLHSTTITKDFDHINSINWEMDNNVVYLSALHLSTVFK